MGNNSSSNSRASAIEGMVELVVPFEEIIDNVSPVVGEDDILRYEESPPSKGVAGDLRVAKPGGY